MILLWKRPDEIEMGAGMSGRFYELRDAYNLGLLMADDIRWIACYHEYGTAISYKHLFFGWGYQR